MSAAPSLRTFLKAPARPAGTLVYYELQGFLFTVASAPELVRPSEWLPIVFGGQEAVYQSLEEAQAILGQLMTAYNDACAMVDGTRDVVLPRGCRFRKDVLENLDDAAPVSQWSRGFLTGHNWLEELWNVDLPDVVDEELAATLMVLSFFASRTMAEAFRVECAPDRSLAEITESMRQAFRGALTGYPHLGRIVGHVLSEHHPSVQEPRRVVKVGRNDPCPCGSGRKFKKCCGESVH